MLQRSRVSHVDVEDASHWHERVQTARRRSSSQDEDIKGNHNKSHVLLRTTKQRMAKKASSRSLLDIFVTFKCPTYVCFQCITYASLATFGKWNSSVPAPVVTMPSYVHIPRYDFYAYTLAET